MSMCVQSISETLVPRFVNTGSLINLPSLFCLLQVFYHKFHSTHTVPFILYHLERY